MILLAKKRRDKERDPSTAGRIAKIGKAALAVGAGAALFYNSSPGKTFQREIAPALLKTKKNISKEIAGKKIDARLIKDTYKKHIGKDNKEFNALRSSLKDNISLNKNNTKTAIGKVKANEQILNNRLPADIKKVYRNEVQSNIKTNLHSNDKFKNLSKHNISQIVDETFDKIDIYRTGEEYSDNLKKKMFDKMNVSNSQRKEILQSIYDTKTELYTPEALKTFTEKQDPYKEQVRKLLYSKDNLSKRRSDTLYGKASSFIKNVTGLDIDTEKVIRGSRSITLGDLDKEGFKELTSTLSKDFTGEINKDGIKQSTNFYEILKDLNKDGSLDDLILDNTLRLGNDGEIFSVKTNKDFTDKFLKRAASTMPGKVMFKGIDVMEQTNKPNYYMLSQGKKSLTSFIDDSLDGTLHTNKVNIGNALYNMDIDINGVIRLDENAALTNGFLSSNKHGSFSRIQQNVLGTNRVYAGASDAQISKLLDLNQTGETNMFSRFKSFITKSEDSRWERNVIDRTKNLLDGNDTITGKLNTVLTQLEEEALYNGNEVSPQQLFARMAHTLQDDNRMINEFFNTLTADNVISDGTIQKLIDGGKLSQDSIDILELTKTGDVVDFFEQIAYKGESAREYSNRGLKNLVNDYYEDSSSTLTKLNINSRRSMKVPMMDMEMATTNVLDIEGVYRRETIKEVLLNESKSSIDGLTSMMEIIGSEELSLKENQSLRYLMNWSVFDKYMGLSTSADSSVNILAMIEESSGSLSNLNDELIAHPTFKNQFLSNFEDMKKDYNIFHKGVYDNINDIETFEYDAYDYVQKSNFGLDLIKNLNDTTKWKSALSELNAGRDNLENFTTATAAVQYSINRLIYGVEAFGIGLSSESMKNPLDTIKNIGLKRVLPAMGAYHLYDYLDYESENLTGTSITGAGANVLANADLSSRKLAYSTGVGQAMDWFKQSSVIGEYLTGSTDYSTEEERREWYKNGYSPVRQGRYWGFGSTSEYRGSNIQYYQANYLRRAHSNYKEMSLYDGDPSQKFKHSLLPSLRHPLSPIKYLMDPYWLEKEHMDDRPYPLTGKMFAEGTPWGAILNPTVGELIKPVRMLPEIKKRLGNDGRDIKEVLSHINNRIKAKGSSNDDMLISDGTDIRNAIYTPYGNPIPSELNLSIKNGQVYSPGINYMKDQVNDISEYMAPVGLTEGDYNNVGNRGYNKAEQYIVDTTAQMSPDINRISTQIINNINNSIKTLTTKGSYDSRAYSSRGASSTLLPDASSEGNYAYTNLVSARTKFDANYYSSKEDYKYINKSIMSDYKKDIGYSLKQLSGIYGFLGESFIGSNDFSYRYEHAGSMTNFSKDFWNSGLGGLGGGVMEIARRFFPSVDRSRVNINPLANNMPDWIPENYRTGDPFNKVPKGEMRLPGKGYESLNDLHEDQFGDYGAFDRFKILADIAPSSDEYKVWRNIAKTTIQDQDLINEMDEIETRVNKMSGKHEFFEYAYTNNSTVYKKGVIKAIEGNKVILANGEKLKLAGIESINEEFGSINDVVGIGEKITYRTTKDAINDLENGVSRNAVIYKDHPTPFVSINVNKDLIDMGIATKDNKDNSALGKLALVSGAQEVLGAAQEKLAHARIPIFHNKLLKVDTSLDSFKHETLYGSNYSTWDHPIEGFIKPMFNETFAQTPLQHLGAIGAATFHFGVALNSDSAITRGLSGIHLATRSPSAMLGGTLNWMLRLNNGKQGGTNPLGAWDTGAKYGSILGTVGWGIANADNPIKATTSFAAAGSMLAHQLNIGDVVSNFKNIPHGAAIGATIGLGLSMLKNPSFDKDKMFGPWMPSKTKKKFELDEYFDRLEYIKYQGLYKQASFRANLFEGSNIGQIFKDMDKNKKKIAKLQKEAKEIGNKHMMGSYAYEEEMSSINKQIQSLQETRKVVFKGGKHTKSAVAYKKAAESTIYGLSETATKDEILAAVPDQYKDHFKAFMDETDSKKQQEIMKYMPNYLQRPLEIAWGKKPSHIKSNYNYFKRKKLPGTAWRGWKPNINLKHVKMKTIENEGMLLSDFGYYNSEKSKAGYYMAPDINNYDEGSGMGYRFNMLNALNGLGVSVQNISVEKTAAPGIAIFSDITQNIRDTNKIANYGVASAMQGITSALF